MAELVGNDVHSITVDGVGEVSLRLQTYSDGALGIRSVPDKDGSGESVALAAISFIQMHLVTAQTEFRELQSRRKGELVTDALHIPGAAARGADLLELVRNADDSWFPVEIP